eukprot:1750075-Prymnesium_polylepis.1
MAGLLALDDLVPLASWEQITRLGVDERHKIHLLALLLGTSGNADGEPTRMRGADGVECGCRTRTQVARMKSGDGGGAHE